MFSICLLLVWTNLFALCQASSQYPQYHEKRAVDSALVPPSADPFYQNPTSFRTTTPGAILRVREAPGNLTSIIQNCSAAYNILYRTTDSRYQPTWAVTTLFIPACQLFTTSKVSCPTSFGAALLSYQIPYDSANVNGSPSFTLYDGRAPDISAALGRGWFVNVPDYEGPLASFTAGVMSGHATLDSVRAVLASGFGLSPTARYVLWGYSGGALASEWAAELQIQYAPELTVAGIVLGGLTPDIPSVFRAVDGTAEAGLIPASILGLASQYPQAYNFLIGQLETSGQYNKTSFLAARNITLDQQMLSFSNQDIHRYFKDGMTALQTPLVQRIINSDGRMGYHGIPQMPLFAYKAIADEVSKIADTDALVDKYCAVGASILYQRNTVGGHQAEEINGVARAFEWLGSALNGTLQQTGCIIQNVTVNITSVAL